MSYPVMSTSIPWSLIKGGYKKTPNFNTVVQPTAASRGDAAFSLKPYATWLFEIDLAYVLGGESIAASLLQSFLGTFMACCGRANYFLFTDPNDNAVTTAQGVMLNVTAGAASPMGQAGDGSSTTFQLARTIGQAVDVIQNMSGTGAGYSGGPNGLTIYVNGVAKTAGTDYFVTAAGVIGFTVAPANGAVLTWSGGFYYLCQFSDDNLKELARVNKNSSGWLWDCPSIKFESRFV